MLQSVAVFCRVLQCVAAACALTPIVFISMTCCSLLQSVPVWCSLLQSVAVCCSVSQRSVNAIRLITNKKECSVVKLTYLPAPPSPSFLSPSVFLSFSLSLFPLFLSLCLCVFPPLSFPHTLFCFRSVKSHFLTHSLSFSLSLCHSLSLVLSLSQLLF